MLEPFDFLRTIEQLDEQILVLLVQQVAALEWHPRRASSQDMSDVFEELLRRCFGVGSYPGEYFSPPDVADLMAQLVLEGGETIDASDPDLAVYDPCCGTGRLLFAFRNHFQARYPGERLALYGQELNPQSRAICLADLFITSPEDAGHVARGSTLADDQHAGKAFRWMMSNPPYGKAWTADQARVVAEAKRGKAGRFGAGLPKVSDGQMLFLQHLLSHMRPVDHGGSRIAVLTNVSPLFHGGAGSGESEIRRWILENDWLEAIVALPEAMFYNTGIATYLWVLTNCKAERRRGKIQCIDARDLWTPMRRPLGEKRRELSRAQCSQIVLLYRAFEEDERSKMCEVTAFGYRRVTIERPLRCAFQVTPERVEALCAHPQTLAMLQVSVRRKNWPVTVHEALRAFLACLPDTLYLDRDAFVRDLEQIARVTGFPLQACLRDVFLAAFAHRDERAEVCRGKDGTPEADPDLRDTERVPLPETAESFFAREVLPFAPDAWINRQVRDPKDGQVGIVGYEINLARLFYRYQPPRSLDAIVADIVALEAESARLLHEIV